MERCSLTFFRKQRCPRTEATWVVELSVKLKFIWTVCAECQHYETVSWESKWFVEALLNTCWELGELEKAAVKGDPNKLLKTLGSCVRKTKSYFRAQITLQNTGKQEQAKEAAETECFLNLSPSPFNKWDFSL